MSTNEARLREALQDLTERAKRARQILTVDGGNWGMLDTSKAEALLAAQPQETAPAAPATATLSEDWPECEEFYNLMQLYRHSPILKQGTVVEAYKEVKSWLRAQVNALLRQAAPASAEGERS